MGNCSAFVISAVENATGDQKVIGRQIFSRPPNESKENKLIRKLKLAAGDKDYCGMSYWADSALAAQAGIPSILFGPAGHGAHAVDEWVSADSLIDTYKAIKKFILDLGG